MKLMLGLFLGISVFSIYFFFIKPESCGASCPATSSASSPDLTPQEFASRIKTGKVVVLDVRTPEEFKTGHISQSKNIDINNKSQFLSSIDSLNKDDTYLIYCRSGNRSSQAKKIMQEKGFTHLSHLLGGIQSWTVAGMALE